MTENQIENVKERKCRSSISLKDLEILLSMRQDGDSFKKISKNLGIARITAQKRYVEIERCISSGDSLNTLITKKKGRPFVEDTATLVAMQQIVQEDSLLVQKGILMKLEEQGISMSQATCSRKLKKVEITRKRVKRVYEKVTDMKVIHERKAFAMKYRNVPDSTLVYLDETGINLHSMENYGYSPKNTPVNVLVKPRGTNVSIMVLISNSSILHYKFVDGPYNAELFVKFLQECLDKNITFQKRILLMDNVRFHKTLALKNFLVSKKIVFDFIPPYSPQLNPIEEFFSAAKSRYHKKRPLPKTAHTVKQYASEVFQDMNTDTTFDINQFYKHMRHFMDLGFTGAFF